MNEQKQIPTTTVERASKFISTGAKIGGNYLRYYAKKALSQEGSKEELEEANADVIYEALSKLKGSALKAAQMLSMDQALLPRVYAEKFQMAQYSAPPLSYPLIAKTFRKHLGGSPEKIFDEFSRKASHAASIGQVHRAKKDGKDLAVKVQYPGVASSVGSDLRMAKRVAARIANIRMSELEYYMEEVEKKLLEETDYELEIRRSMELAKACQHLHDIKFPTYYPKYSSKRIITMDWIEGQHLKEWIAGNPDQADRNRIGQALWNFFAYQTHVLKLCHADPHPGNFIVTTEGDLAIIDFGCVKDIPVDFYESFYALITRSEGANQEELSAIYQKMDMFHPDDTPEEKDMFIELYNDIIELFGLPFRSGHFDFGDSNYFNTIFGMIETVSKDKKIRKANAGRGSRDGIYINRIYLGLFSILNELKATVDTSVYLK